MERNGINLEDDFLTFSDQIIQKFGYQYYDQTSIFFERAAMEATRGLLRSAVADGKFALELANYSSAKSGIYYLHGFLCQVHCDLGLISKSKAYYELGLKFLEPCTKSYEDDKKMFNKLRDMIDSESWKETSDDDPEDGE